jgi:hypothetical protein
MKLRALACIAVVTATVLTGCGRTEYTMAPPVPTLAPPTPAGMAEMPPAPPQPPNTFNNRYGTDSNSPRIYDSQGGYHGNINNNPYDPNSVANPYGRYGSPYSPDSTKNPYGQYGSPYAPQSPTNPYGTGMPVYGTNP